MACALTAGYFQLQIGEIRATARKPAVRSTDGPVAIGEAARLKARAIGSSLVYVSSAGVTRVNK